MIEYRIVAAASLEGSLYEQEKQFSALVHETVARLNEHLNRPKNPVEEHAALIGIIQNVVGSLEQIRRNVYYLQVGEMSRYLRGTGKRPVESDKKYDYKKQDEINAEVLAELQEMQARPNVNYIQILKLLSLYQLESVKQVEFTCDYKVVNNETLLDVEYPDHLIPEEFCCPTLSTIMSDPCEITTCVTVDRQLIIKSKQNGKPNPYTKQPWPENIETNSALQNRINLFVRKIEWLYLAFQKDRQFTVLYANSAIQDFLQDSTISYNDFAIRVKQFILEHPEVFVARQDAITPAQAASLVAFRLNVAYPPKYIFDLFLDNGMRVTLHPKQDDYEKLIRRLTAVGDHKGLEVLLSSPILDFVAVDIYACNVKDENVLDILQANRVKYPNLAVQLAECEKLLRKYKEPADCDIPSSTRWIRKAGAYYLPSFNRVAALSALVAVAAAAKGISDHFYNENKTTPIRPDLS